jgi:hypothetical protein
LMGYDFTSYSPVRKEEMTHLRFRHWYLCVLSNGLQ